MTENHCPKCEGSLDWKNSDYYCESCEQGYKKVAPCPDCATEMEKLQACGSVSYFCNSCNELKSKSRSKTHLVKL
ncbi:MAG: zinc ribbon domain-containing protein [Aliivibrio sp.]|uniref:zinc ribbon domain-containing protein n=1 Tax=Aliivibrio sp. TaxID=1872443 RepID=UPI001A619348|nr:zinc ribbon domain-containing protein [Aliivibrio sp.]